MKNLILLLLVIPFLSANSQENKTNFWNEVRFGGSFGLGFGNDITTIAVSPSAIYDFNPFFSAGIQIGYQYSKRNDFSSNVFSSGILGIFNPFDSVQLSTEFEQLFVNQKIGSDSSSYNYPALYLGGAYRVSANISLGFRYDILFNRNKSIYASAISPVFRVFF